MAKLVTIERLQDGWDGPGSKAPQRGMLAAYREFLESVSADRAADAEPVAMRDGSLRIEWDRDRRTFVAEIEPTGGMYLCILGESDDDDVDQELDQFDLSTLIDFFEHGELRA